jgi:hypothetical protein
VPDPTAPKRLPEDAVRALLKEGGGWERLHAELEQGTGLGANLVPAERKALIARFEAHREVLARNVGTVLGGEVVITDAGAARQIEVHFTGADAPQQVKQAQDYLDAKSPGWAQQTGVKIVAVPASTKSKRAQSVGQALEYRLTPQSRHLAQQLVPIYEQWHSLRTPEARFDALLAVVNRPLVAAGAPPLIPNYLSAPKAHQFGAMDFAVWDLNMNRDLLSVRDPTPEQFAAAVDTMAHEARHALQWFRMARLDPSKLVGKIDPQALKAAREANQGLRRAERFQPGQLKYQEAQAYYESVYGTGAADRARIYNEKKARFKEEDHAYDDLQAAMELPLNHPLRRQAEQAYAEAVARSEAAQEAYEYLVEEVDARRHGQTVAQAVKERLADLRALDRARDGERAAYRRYRAAQNLAVMPRHALRLEKRQQDREEALRRYEAAAAIVKRLEDRLAGAAKKATKP